MREHPRMGAAYGRERARCTERRERRRGCESGELPPSRSNLGSQRSRERPETPGTPDCTASAAVSLACSSHRVRLLTSRAVTSHRLPLGVTRGTATAAPGSGGLRAGGTAEALPAPCAAPAAPPAPHRDVPSLRGPEVARPVLPVQDGSAVGRQVGEWMSGRAGPRPGHRTCPSPTLQPHVLT